MEVLPMYKAEFKLGARLRIVWHAPISSSIQSRDQTTLWGAVNLDV